MKKQLLALMLAAAAAPAYGAGLEALNQYAPQVIDKLNQLRPIAQDAINGNFEQLRGPLSSLPAAQVIDALQSAMGTLQQELPSLLAKVPFDALSNYLSADQIAVAQQGVSFIQNNLGQLNSAANQLNALKNYLDADGTLKDADVDTIISALNSVKNDPAYVNNVQPALRKLWDKKLSKIYAWLQQNNRSARIENAIKFAAAKISDPSTQVTLDDINNIAVVFGLVRRIVATVSDLSGVALALNKALAQSGIAKQLPSQVSTALLFVHANAKKIEQDLNTLVTKIKQAIGATLQADEQPDSNISVPSNLLPSSSAVMGG